MDEKTKNLLTRVSTALKNQKASPADTHEVVLKLQEPKAIADLSSEIQSSKTSLKTILADILQAIQGIKLSPPQVTLNSPSEVSIKKPSWTSELFSLKNIEEKLDLIKQALSKDKDPKPLEFPKDPKNPMAVRLSNGKDFIEQMTQFVQQGGGGTSIPKVTSTASGQTNTITVPVSNPDGSNIFAGPANPSVDSYAHKSISLTPGANQVLVASSPSKQIWVYGVGFTVSATGTISFQDEDDLAITGVMNFAQYSGLNTPPSGNFSMPIWKLGTDKDLEVDIITSTMTGWLDYAIVSV